MANFLLASVLDEGYEIQTCLRGGRGLDTEVVGLNASTATLVKRVCVCKFYVQIGTIMHPDCSFS